MISANTPEQEMRQVPGSLGNGHYPGTGIALRTALKSAESKAHCLQRHTEVEDPASQGCH